MLDLRAATFVMVSHSSLLLLVLGNLLSGSSAASIPSLSKRWDTSVCTAETAGVPIPDADNFQLPLENLRQDMCWDLCIGDQALCTTKTKICYNFIGTNLIFDYGSITGYTYTEADIYLGLAAPAGTPTSQYTTANGYCAIATDQTTVHCEIPYSAIVNTEDVLAGMCPYGDQQGYVFYLYTNAQLSGLSGPVSATGRLSCTDYPACTSYYPSTFWELTYRCTKCPDVPSPPPPPPVIEYCSVGTAFGYSAGAPASLTLNSLVPKPKTCNRWGWYASPSAAQLTAGIGGPLYVGAGQNDITKATNVGTWSAKLQGAAVVVTYALAGPYYLAEAHVDVGCLPFKTCAPGKFAYSNEGLAGTTTFTTPLGALTLPSCGAGVYVIVHAAVDTIETIPAAVTDELTCHAPLAS